MARRSQTQRFPLIRVPLVALFVLSFRPGTWGPTCDTSRGALAEEMPARVALWPHYIARDVRLSTRLDINHLDTGRLSPCYTGRSIDFGGNRTDLTCRRAGGTSWIGADRSSGPGSPHRGRGIGAPGCSAQRIAMPVSGVVYWFYGERIVWMTPKDRIQAEETAGRSGLPALRTDHSLRSRRVSRGLARWRNDEAPLD